MIGTVFGKRAFVDIIKLKIFEISSWITQCSLTLMTSVLPLIRIRGRRGKGTEHRKRPCEDKCRD